MPTWHHSNGTGTAISQAQPSECYWVVIRDVSIGRGDNKIMLLHRTRQTMIPFDLRRETGSKTTTSTKVSKANKHEATSAYIVCLRCDKNRRGGGGGGGFRGKRDLRQHNLHRVYGGRCACLLAFWREDEGRRLVCTFPDSRCAIAEGKQN